ncbi:hypothetical protein [Nocardioides daejeonensis]|uniref:hypothetical protein n=1 Tax=Nocardioides daejeonensis TaxID=1046556 RepID=UPI0013A5890B|nr:hypothetical protein [Nocardioides daejeonensis]
MNGDDYCELCDLPLSQCPHGRPAPAPAPPPAKKAPAPRTRTPKEPATPRARKSPEPPVRTSAAVRKWTPSDQLEPVIIQILEQAGGELDNDGALAAIEERLGEHFRSGDRDRTPTGELRWQLAARKARQSLIRQGLMTKERPGIWTLS